MPVLSQKNIVLFPLTCSAKIAKLQKLFSQACTCKMKSRYIDSIEISHFFAFMLMLRLLIFSSLLCLLRYLSAQVSGVPIY